MKYTKLFIFSSFGPNIFLSRLSSAIRDFLLSLAEIYRFWDENKITGYNLSCLERKPDDNRFWTQYNLLHMIKGNPVLALICLQIVLAWKYNVLSLFIVARPVIKQNSWDLYPGQASARILQYDNNRLFYYCPWNRRLKYEVILNWRLKLPVFFRSSNNFYIIWINRS